MSKRAAEVQLTQDNVDLIDEETEEAGQFTVASDEQLKQRVIKKARRNKPAGEESSGPSIFAGLNTTGPIGLLSKPGGTSGVAPLIRVPLGSPPTSVLSLGGPSGSGGSASTSPYLVQLKALNESVTDWIKKHVSSNPYVDLTPIFKDYQTHLTGIEKKYKTAPEESSKPNDSEASEDNTEDAAEDDQPKDDTPTSRPLITPAEEDCLISTRAKLFYKKESEYAELGVGTLRVEETAENKTVRLLLRNDTSMGKILLNVKVNKDIPVSSKGNNVFLICQPNPPLTREPSDTPVSYLIRVKTAVLADKLLTTVKENVN